MENIITALDTGVMEELGLVQPSEQATETPTEEVSTQGSEPAVEPQEETTETEAPATTEVTPLVIEGIGEIKPEDIKEWKQGYLRQSDYTKKTQELAKQREDMAAAVEVFEYLRQNPHLVEQLKSLDDKGAVNQGVMSKTAPENDMIRQLWYTQKSMEIDMQVNRLKEKYGTQIDEVALFEKAAELGTEDLEFVYRAISFDNKSVDERALIDKAKAELKAELEATKRSVSTIATAPASQVQTPAKSLTDQEKRIANGLGLTESEYAKWKTR